MCLIWQVVEPLKLTLEELKAYNGEDKSKPILLAIRGIVFDVSRGTTSINQCMHASGSFQSGPVFCACAM